MRRVFFIFFFSALVGQHEVNLAGRKTLTKNPKGSLSEKMEEEDQRGTRFKGSSGNGQLMNILTNS